MRGFAIEGLLAHLQSIRRAVVLCTGKHLIAMDPGLEKIQEEENPLTCVKCCQTLLT